MKAGIKGAHRRLSKYLKGRPGIVGTAVGVTSGEPCIRVYLSVGSRETGAHPPHTWEGFRVVVEKTGPFRSRFE